MERPSSKSSVRRQGSAESLNRADQTAMRQQGSDQLAKTNIPEEAGRKSSRISMAPPVALLQTRGDLQSLAGCSKAAGDTLSAAVSSKAAKEFTSAAGGSKAAGDLKPRRSERITTAEVQEVSGKLDNLNISKKPGGSQPKVERPQRNPGAAGISTAATISTGGPSTAVTSIAGPSRTAAARKRTKPTGEKDISAKKLVMSAIDEVKSRKGVSLAAIDRNIRSKVGAQAKHWRPYVRTYLRQALKTGKLVHAPSRKLKDGQNGRVAKGLQGYFKRPVAVKKSTIEKPTKKSVKAKKVTKVKKTQGKPSKLLKKPGRHQNRRPAQRTVLRRR